jgi:hypothetical protein
MLQNATYTFPSDIGEITLKNAIFHNEEWWIASGIIAFGDLDSDGVQDAAVEMGAHPTGGSMNAIFVFAVLNNNGVPEQAAYTAIGDRTPIYKMAIRDGRIVINGEVGPWYERTQFHTPVVLEYRLADRALLLTRLTSKDADGRERAIHINVPAGGSTVACSVRVRSSITFPLTDIEPNYSITGPDGRRLDWGSIPVESDDSGSSGSFDETIDLTNVPAGIAFHLEISEEVWNNYSWSSVALDSVDLLS